MSKALVTGGAGFIGSHLVERLLADGHQVTVLDNLSTGRLENLAAVAGNSSLTIHRVDITQVESIRPHFSGIEWVFHLAARADIVPSIQQPLVYHSVNVGGTVAVLEASRAADVRRLIYAASSSCYGIPDQIPTPEAAPIKPMYPYALTKYLGEQCVMHWNQVYRLPCVALRLFNVYGPRARTSGAYGAVFGVFMAQKLAEKPFTVVGDGTQTRDFTFATDVADAMVTTATSEIAGEVFNVGSGNTYSINYLVSLLGGQVVYVPKRPGEPDCTFGDTTKIAHKLGWRPKVSFEEGVEYMMRDIGHWREAPVWNEKTIKEATREWFAYLGSQR
jgi:UDP-glucose 4-epimerase